MGKEVTSISLPYGRGRTRLSLPAGNLLGVLAPEPVPAVRDLAGAVAGALERPIGTPPLAELLARKKPGSALVILSDQTRIVPGYPGLLPVLLGALRGAGLAAGNIRLLIACGNHRAPNCEEREEIYGKETVDTYPLYAHSSELDCVPLGVLSTGHGLGVNRLLLTSDFIIATGKITPHYLAGYSGGRKAVMPGCASRESIAMNHAMVVRGRSGPGMVAGNPIHEEMDEAAAKVGIDFLLNLVPTPGGRVAGVFAGHWRRAFEQGTELCRRTWSAGFRDRADCVVASAGGHPADANLYQLQRVLNNVAPAVKPGGTIVLVGACGEGVGQKEFGEWMGRHSVPEILAMPEAAITAEAHRAYATASIMERCEVAVVSGMDPDGLGRLKFTGLKNLPQAVRHLAKKHGPDFSCYVVPHGYATMLEGD